MLNAFSRIAAGGLKCERHLPTRQFAKPPGKENAALENKHHP